MHIFLDETYVSSSLIIDLKRKDVYSYVEYSSSKRMPTSAALIPTLGCHFKFF
jgi:hypothetical protein